MKVVDIAKAQLDIEQLLAGVEPGEEILLERQGQPVARLIKQPINRTPGVLAQYKEWSDWKYDPSVFAPLMTDDDVRAEGYDV